VTCERDTLYGRPEIRQFLDKVITAMSAYQYSRAEISTVRLAAEEALVNAIECGNPMKAHYVVRPEHVHVKVQPVGVAFEPDPLASATTDSPGGRGFMLLLTPQVTWIRYSKPGSRVASGTPPA